MISSKIKSENGRLDPYLADDYNYYCRDGILYCAHCDSFSGRYIQCQIDNSKQQNYLISCDACGEVTNLTLRYSELEYLMGKYHFVDDNKDAQIYSFWKMFNLLSQYPHLMKDADSKRYYKEVMKRLVSSFRIKKRKHDTNKKKR